MSLFHRRPAVTRIADLAAGAHGRVIGTVVATDTLLVTAHGGIECVAYGTYIDEPLAGFIGFHTPATVLTSPFALDDGSGRIAVAEDPGAKIELHFETLPAAPDEKVFGASLLDREVEASRDHRYVRSGTAVPYAVAAVRPGDKVSVEGTVEQGPQGLRLVGPLVFSKPT